MLGKAAGLPRDQLTSEGSRELHNCQSFEIHVVWVLRLSNGGGNGSIDEILCCQHDLVKMWSSYTKSINVGRSDTDILNVLFLVFFPSCTTPTHLRLSHYLNTSGLE